MLLSQLFQKIIYTDETPCALVVGVGFSLKNYTIKHLLCSTQIKKDKDMHLHDFAVNVSAISSVADGISLPRLRPVLPQSAAKLFPNLPVYSHNGTFLGNLTDGEITNYTITSLSTDSNHLFQPSSIAICKDAVFLRKEQPYPLGQRVPSPLLSQLQCSETSVTKPLLRRALRQGALVKLTLSLPPFDVLLKDEN